MIVIGITGSIGMGKSTVAEQLSSLGVPAYNADTAVHSLLGAGGVGVGPVSAAFPEALAGNAIDRALLGKLVFNQPEKLKLLEQILHPLVRAEEDKFKDAAKARGERAVAIDIPLLYETGGETRCDAVIVVSAPHFIQKKRVLARPGMTEEKFHAILSRQMPDREKRKRADFVVCTGLGKAVSLWQLKRILGKLCVK